MTMPSIIGSENGMPISIGVGSAEDRRFDVRVQSGVAPAMKYGTSALRPLVAERAQCGLERSSRLSLQHRSHLGHVFIARVPRG